MTRRILFGIGLGLLAIGFAAGWGGRWWLEARRDRPSEAQFRELERLNAAVARLGDAFGSEATSSGLIIPTKCQTLDAAVRGHLPAGWRVVPLDFEAFADQHRRRAEDPAPIAAFLEAIAGLPHEAALVGGPEFRPQAHDRGRFHVALFLRAKDRAGVNLLICFERVET